MHVLDIDATVVKSDLETTDSFWQGLRDAVRPLEQVPERLKDWHPGSNGLVLDLLHPSLFPLQYGKSRVLPEGIVPLHECTEYIGKGEIVPIPTAVTDETTGTFTKDLSWGNSHNLRPYGSFQWLPSDVSFRPDGTAKIDSYVNNLHPQDHGELYSILEQAVSKAVPLWNDCLVQNGRIRIHPYSCGYETFVRPARFDEDVREHTGDTDSDDDIQDEDNWAREERFHDWIQDEPEARLIHQPFPFEKYVPMDQREIEKLDVQTAFPGGLQVIFKLANIELDPAGPTVDGELSRCEYNGSNFHVEGALNEHIAATALFYYDQRNVTDSYLEFRQQVDAEDMVARPEQHEYVAAERLYGIKNEEAAIQNIGKVLTKPGRLLAFPNVLQHKVGKFSLQDQTAGHGYRKILAMFLVDPHIRILSTANVPPQRLDWWADEVRKADRFSTLPVELFDRIMEEVEDFPISWAKACEDREVLMAERGRITEQYDEAMSEVSTRVSVVTPRDEANHV